MDGGNPGPTPPATLPRAPWRNAQHHRPDHGVVLRRGRRHAVLPRPSGRQVRPPTGAGSQPGCLRSGFNDVPLTGRRSMVRAHSNRAGSFRGSNRGGVDVRGGGPLLRSATRSGRLTDSCRATLRHRYWPGSRGRRLSTSTRSGLLRDWARQSVRGGRHLQYQSRGQGIRPDAIAQAPMELTARRRALRRERERTHHWRLRSVLEPAHALAPRQHSRDQAELDHVLAALGRPQSRGRLAR